MLDTIPPALRDRMEVIELPGYTEEEKLEIAKRHLVPRQLEGARPGRRAGSSFDDEALRTLIREYTREAGVRNLEREIASVCRKVARKVVEESIESESRSTPEAVHELPRPGDVLPRDWPSAPAVPGVATGLAWTPAGGEILFIEATRMPGKGKLTLTGQLGDVMKESAPGRADLDPRQRRASCGIDADVFERSDLHIHVPGGRHPQGRPLGRASPSPRAARLAAHRAPGGGRDWP